ncbi:uncharacterized protein LOC120016669 isoform X2 [Tripterygium wilfordii]|uniref:uncharacterized protein LOC120016669 isoform X2 n=1 Tax=Tripterygium wilfordii TaxID=458696 RepID=UPI0018F8123D|nr:uncharacterized protein LOC120016669 isoform X2 [Tripterygium wilfordii]
MRCFGWINMFFTDYETLFDKEASGMLHDTSGVMIEEQLAIFLNFIGHNERNRVIQEWFQHSGETISRHFNNVLKAVKSLLREFLEPPPLTTPTEILKSTRFFPYFKDCIGFIDGMHIRAHVHAKDQSRFRNQRGFLSQNVLAACTFDMQFIFVYPGWEGSVADSQVLRAVLDDPDQNFPHVPEGKYYVVDILWGTQTWKDLLLHIQECDVTSMNIRVLIIHLEMQRSCLITSIHLLEMSSRSLSMFSKLDFLFSNSPFGMHFMCRETLS